MVLEKRSKIRATNPLRSAEEESWKVCHIIPDFPVSSLSNPGTGPLVDHVINPKVSAPTTRGQPAIKYNYLGIFFNRPF